MANKKKEKVQMFDESTEHSDIVRYPVKLYVDGIEFDPTDEVDVVRTAYDLEMSPYDMKKLHDWLHTKLEKDPYGSVKIRVIGRLVS